MTRIADGFAARRTRGEAAFVAYLTAGDPSLDVTPELLQALVAGGADLIELGVPFHARMADGPGTQRAAARAIKAGTSLSRILELVATRGASCRSRSCCSATTTRSCAMGTTRSRATPRPRAWTAS